VAVLLRTEGKEDLERSLMGDSPKLQAILEAAGKRFREGAGIPHEIRNRSRTRRNSPIDGLGRASYNAWRATLYSIFRVWNTAKSHKSRLRG
jgi:hypothetical protein